MHFLHQYQRQHLYNLVIYYSLDRIIAKWKLGKTWYYSKKRRLRRIRYTQLIVFLKRDQHDKTN